MLRTIKLNGPFAESFAFAHAFAEFPERRKLCADCLRVVENQRNDLKRLCCMSATGRSVYIGFSKAFPRNCNGL